MPYKDPEVRRVYGKAQMRRLRGSRPEHYNKQERDRRRLKKDWLDTQKVQCARCTETHIACLDFHHRDPAQKEFLLSTAVGKHPLDRIKLEAAKCDVLCANCHRKLHYDERHAT